MTIRWLKELGDSGPNPAITEKSAVKKDGIMLLLKKSRRDKTMSRSGDNYKTIGQLHNQNAYSSKMQTFLDRGKEVASLVMEWVNYWLQNAL